MGDQGDDILSSFGLTEEDKNKYDIVKEKFQGYFVKKHNVIFERAKFNMRSQMEGESTDSFVTALHGLAEHCNFRDLKEELIRDRLVVGLRDAALSEKLQMDPGLTLEKAVTSARQKEAVRKQQPLLRGDAKEIKPLSEDPLPNVDVVKKFSGPGPRKSNTFPQNQRKFTPQCYRCGRPYQRGHQCPAINAICRKCNRRGHFQEACRSSSQVQEVQCSYRLQEEEEESFLGAVQVRGIEGSKPWRITVSVNGSPVDFKVDTGADVTVIPSSMITSGNLKASLSPCTKQLCGPGNKTLDTEGQFLAHLTYKERSTQETIIVVNGLQMPLLGRPAISQLQLIQRLDALSEQSKDPWPIQEFPQLFTGLGKLEGEYSIKLKTGATPYSLSTPRHVAIPLLPKVKAELKRMQDLGVITPVEEATDWCAGMVVVPKANGGVRICVDLTKLNESVCREKHPIPPVDQTLGQLTGVKYFSKLDANSGFWQVPLSRESLVLTTFITPFGRFRFNRVPFGITSAPEHFQRRISAILSGLDGVSSHIDDILAHGKTKEEHDSNLRNALTRLAHANLTLNREKCRFFQTSVDFLGYTIDLSGVSPDVGKVQALQDMPPPTNPSEVRRFLGMANQFGKFIPDLADTTKPLRDLLIKDHQWVWDHQQQDTTCQKLMQYCQQGWPSRDKLPGMFKPYLTVATEFSIKEGLLMRGRRIVVPAVLQKEILDRLHTGHQGITKCRQRARQSVWWLHISAQIEELIRKCPTCCIEQKPRAEPMIPSLLPDRPWHKVGMDLFYWDQATYLLIVDYYSRYIEVSRLSSESAQEVIRHTKSIFARHGIPAEVVSDNGPQFTSEEFQRFSKQYCFSHKTSSSYYPQGNGEAERAVQTVKMLLKKENDAYLALLAYRATPLSCGYSPAQLLMSRQLRSTVPECQENLLPKVPDKVVVTNHDHKMKVQQKANYDRRHGVRPSQPLHPGNPVWIRDRKETGKVVEMTGSRSYSVQTGQGLHQRNRQHLIHLPEEYSNYSDAGDTDSEPENPSTDAGETLGHSPHSPRRSERNADDQPRRSERNTQKPDRYEPSW